MGTGKKLPTLSGRQSQLVEDKFAPTAPIVSTAPIATRKPRAKAAPPINPYDARVLASGTKVSELEGQAPGAYQSVYQTQVDALLQGILKGEKFQYDVQMDPLYKQYKEQYVTLGNHAMRDTTANAAQLTGGYGNSYAATAGNQAYQSHLSALNSVVPDLYDSAMAAHRDAQTQKQAQLSALQRQEGMDYQRYMDEADAYQKRLQYWYQKYRDDQLLQNKWKK